MDALDSALRVIASLNQAGVDYVVVGGVAMNVHGLVRATEDRDMLSARTIKRGVQRFRTIQDANAAREHETPEHMRRTSGER